MLSERILMTPDRHFVFVIIMYVNIMYNYVYTLLVCLFAGVGRWLVLTDSIAKYVRVNDKTEVLAFPGDTVKKLTDRIAFGEVSVVGYSRILIHVGCNDVSNSVFSKKERRYTTVITIMDRFRALRSVIRRVNSGALLLFSSILPRREKYQLFRPLIQGLNFALEKFCAKSKGTNIFIPSFRCFLSHGEPRPEYFSDSDGLHLDGAGVVKLQGVFQQALSSGYLRVRVKCERAKMLAAIKY